MAIKNHFYNFFIYHKTVKREFIRPKIHKTRIFPKVGNMTLLTSPCKPGFYGVGLPGRVISCQLSQPQNTEFRNNPENFDPWVQMLFKYNSYLELWRHFRSTEPNHLCNFGRGHHEK